jgi:hypothetical protein
VIEAPSWVSSALIAVPLFGLAGSAIAFVIRLYIEAAEKRRELFFRLITNFESVDVQLFTRVAAAYRLREFREHKEFLIRFLTPQITTLGGEPAAVSLMTEELNQTIQALGGKKNIDAPNQ